MTTVADPRVAELEAREQEYLRRAKEADPSYWTTKADAARANIEQKESDRRGEQREAVLALATVSTEYAVAQEGYLTAIGEFQSAITAYAAVAADFDRAKARVRRVGADFPADVPATLSTRMSRLSERWLYNLILSARSLGIYTD
jgi:hypothetical protein